MMEKIMSFLARYQEGPKEGRYSFAGKRDEMVRYLKGLKCIQRISEKEKPCPTPEAARKAGAV